MHQKVSHHDPGKRLREWAGQKLTHSNIFPGLWRFLVHLLLAELLLKLHEGDTSWEQKYHTCKNLLLKEEGWGKLRRESVVKSSGENHSLRGLACKRNLKKPDLKDLFITRLMLRFPPILAKTKSHLDHFHRPSKTGFFKFPVYSLYHREERGSASGAFQWQQTNQQHHALLSTLLAGWPHESCLFLSDPKAFNNLWTHTHTHTHTHTRPPNW